MKKQLRSFILAITLFGSTATFAQQTIPFPQPSPMATITQNFATSKIEVAYSRPSVKGRAIFGDVVPYNKFWRTGANAPTTITFGEDVTINGTALKAGKYGLVSIPGQTEWIIIFTKEPVNDETDYKKELDAARVVVPSRKTASRIETFTISFDNMATNSCELSLAWDNTLIVLNIAADYDARIMKQIETVMAKDSRPYYQSANYYYENKKDLNQALIWVNKALEANPKAYWIYLLKAKIQKELKDYQGALITSQQSYDLAKEDQNETYMKNNEKLMNEIKSLPDYKPAPPVKKKK